MLDDGMASFLTSNKRMARISKTLVNGESIISLANFNWRETMKAFIAIVMAAALSLTGCVSDP